MTLAIQTDDFWDASADGYIASAEPFTALFCEDVVKLAEIEPGMTLLDVATGPGALALAAARAGARVTAIDFSAAMIERLTARIGALPVTARRMNGEALDVADSSFDRACSVFGIPLFPDWRAGLRELARVLKPGGLAVVATADNPVGFGPNTLFAEARAACLPGQPAAPEIDGMAQLSDRERLTVELRDAGFREVVIHARTHDFTFEASQLGDDNPMLVTNPLVADLSDADRATVIAHAIQLAQQRRDGDLVRLRGTAHFAVARR